MLGLLFLGVILLQPFVTSLDEWLYDNPNTLPDRQVMVQLFEWKWPDVAKECETFLSHYGYGAVQISPPQEHIVEVNNNNMPWWIRYQPVSYKLISRSGNREEFIDMVNRCNKVGVRIVVDAVLNHMTGVGMKKGEYGVSSSGGSDFNSYNNQEYFPGVPYDHTDFNDYRCDHNIEGSDYQFSADHVRNCRLVGLVDLNQGKESVRQKMIAYLNGLIDLGVAGFRFDAGKHMWPGDLAQIVGNTKNLREDIFGPNKRPFAVYEVIDRGGEAVKAIEYISLGRYTDFTYGALLTAVARGQHKDFSDLRYWGPGYGYGSFASHDILAFIDNHDNQRDSYPYVLTYKDQSLYAMVVGFMLGWNYGYPRVMSSYYFSYSDQGPPNLGPEKNYAISSPEFDERYKTCKQSSGWVCEHRWQAIRGMTHFHSAVTGTNITVISAQTGSNQIAFLRGDKGFFALNNQRSAWWLRAQTNLPKGCYCEVWSGEPNGDTCTGKTVFVDENGMANVQVPPGEFAALHVGSTVPCKFNKALRKEVYDEIHFD